jgi:rubrerythrin
MAEITEKIKDYMSSANVSLPMLLDHLSEFLAVERGGKMLYQAALSIAHNPDVLRQFQKFYEQTAHHEEVLTRLITELGGDPAHISPAARLAEMKARSLLDTMNSSNGLSRANRAPATSTEQVAAAPAWSSTLAELNAMENIVLAETKDHADWELLGKISRQSSDERIREVLKPVVSDIENEEDQHLNWTKQKLAELTMAALSK